VNSKYRVTYKRTVDQNQSNGEADQAAAASVTKLDTYQYGKSSSRYHQERKRWWSKLIFTIGSAILVGSIFGVMMLFIFGQEQEVPALKDSEALPSRAEPSLAEANDQEVGTLELAPLAGYVIQMGAYQDFEQAEQAQEQLLAENYQTVIWETDTDYRVFLAAYPSKEIAKQVGEQFIDAGIDVYARDWTTAASTIEGTNSAWIAEFCDLWQQSLTSYSEALEQDWRAWLNVDQAELSEPLQTFQQKIAATLLAFNEQTRPYDLLVVWYHYQQLSQ